MQWNIVRLDETGSTNDDADREVDDIALHREFLEFLQHDESSPATTGSFRSRKCGRLLI